MNKKRILVIALILFLGLGTFVFANPSEEFYEEMLLDEEVEGDIGEEDDSIDDDYSHSDLSSISPNEKIEDKNGVIQAFARDTVNINTTLDFMFGGNQDSSNSNSNSNSNSDSNLNGDSSIGGGNQGGGESGDKDEEVIIPDPSNPPGGSTEPEEPDSPSVPVDPTEPDGKDSYEELKKLVILLQNKVKNARSREDILQAISDRDQQRLEQRIKSLQDEVKRQELLTLLNEINIILNDVTKPIIHGALDQGYYNSDVLLTVEEESIKEIRVNGKVVASEKSLHFTSEGKYEVVVLDSSYNKTSIIFTIDKTAPIATVETSNAYEKTNEDVTVYIRADEALKPVDGWVLSSNKRELSKVFTENTTSSIVIEDLAGNQTNVPYKVFDINRDVPTVDKDQIHYSITTLTNGDVVVTITTDKAVFTPSGWTMISGSTVFQKVYHANAVEKVVLKDAYHNIGYVTIEVNNIDKIPPVAKFVVDSKKTNQSVVGKIVSNEPLKEVSGWISSTNGMELVKVFSDNEKGHVTVEDLAGNQAIVSYEVQTIDREVSGISVSTSNNGRPTNRDVVVTISADEELEAVEGWLLAADQKSISRVFSANIKSSVIVTDKAGNQQEVEYEVFDIDKTPAAVGDIKYSLTSDNQIKVTIKTDKAVFTPNGWTMVKNSQVFTKVYTESMTETIRLKDAYHNRLNFVITIDVDEIRKQLLAGEGKTLSGNRVVDAVSPVVSSVTHIAKNIIF